MRLNLLLLVAASSVALSCPSTASAAVYTWSFSTVTTTGLSPISGSGSLTTNDVAVGGRYLVTAFSGTWGGVNISALLPTGSLGNNDNTIDPLSALPFSYGGLSFSVSSAVQGFTQWNLFTQSGGTYTETNTNNVQWVDGNFALAPGNAVPEPATWAMMIGGFAIVGASMRRQKAKISFA